MNISRFYEKLWFFFTSFFPVSLNETKKIVDFQLYETTLCRKVFYFSELFFGPFKICLGNLFLMKLENKNTPEEISFIYIFFYARNLMWTHEILWPVLCKKWGFRRNLIYFLFLLWHSFHVKTARNCLNDFLIFLPPKNETGWWFHVMKLA